MSIFQTDLIFLIYFKKHLTYMKNYVILAWNLFFRLAQQGYKTPEDIGSVSTVSNSVQVVETLTLKELTEKTSTDYIRYDNK